MGFMYIWWINWGSFPEEGEFGMSPEIDVEIVRMKVWIALKIKDRNANKYGATRSVGQEETEISLGECFLIAYNKGKTP